MSGPGELEAIRERYSRRATIPTGRYSRFNPEVLARVHERQRATIALLATQGIRSLEGLDVIEVGCGSGGNLIEFLFFYRMLRERTIGLLCYSSDWPGQQHWPAGV